MSGVSEYFGYFRVFWVFKLYLMFGCTQNDRYARNFRLPDTQWFSKPYWIGYRKTCCVAGIGYPLFSGEGEHTFISNDMDSWIDVEVLIKFEYFYTSFFVRPNLLKMQRTQQTLALWTPVHEAHMDRVGTAGFKCKDEKNNTIGQTALWFQQNSTTN